MTIRFEGKVAIVTGAGGGLGKSHALALAERGAKVVINDLGSAMDGSGASSEAALAVVKEIVDAGGEAFAHGANVAKFDEVQNMVQQTVDKWGRVDILINNAGILRDKSFAKMEISDFQLVMDVHLMGAANCSKAVWAIMKEQNYGRILMTTSSSGLYGNFGQANYGAAKMAVIGLMNTLVIEGAKNNIKVNSLAPTAGTRMIEDILPPDVVKMLRAEAVTAGALILVHDDAPTRYILCAGAGGYASTRIVETEGIILPAEEQTPENVLAQWDEVSNISTQKELPTGFAQSEKFLAKAKAFVEGK